MVPDTNGTRLEDSAMDRIWLKQYPPGVPHDIDTQAFCSLKEILEKSCKKFASLPAYTNMGTTLRYRDVESLSRQFGAYLQTVLGLDKGDRVAVMMPNLLQYPIAVFGASSATEKSAMALTTTGGSFVAVTTTVNWSSIV